MRRAQATIYCALLLVLACVTLSAAEESVSSTTNAHDARDAFLALESSSGAASNVVLEKSRFNARLITQNFDSEALSRDFNVDEKNLNLYVLPRLSMSEFLSSALFLALIND